MRYVVNTHFHFDHAHGNQTFGDDVEIIGHKFTREQLASGASTEGRAWDLFVGGLPDRIKEMQNKLQTAIDATDADAEAKLRKSTVRVCTLTPCSGSMRYWRYRTVAGEHKDSLVSPRPPSTSSVKAIWARTSGPWT